MKFISVVGARPQFIKVAPIDWELEKRGFDHLILHTGQHYDEAMSTSFFEELNIAAPTWNLEVGSGAHGEQTGKMLVGAEKVFSEARPDWIICYGDTNSTVAAALGAVKMHLPIAHVEAGLRSFNRSMPEEHNRVVADHLCDVLFAPSEEAVQHLTNEGLAERAVLVGDVMVDVMRRVEAAFGEPCGLGDFFVATIHRAENTDDRNRLSAVVAALASLPLPVHLYAHPRLVQKCNDFDITLGQGAIVALPPVSYMTLMNKVQQAQGVITDSGGLQKEAYLLGTPCTTVRPETEWTETLHDGWNVLAEPGNVIQTAGRPVPTTPVDRAAYGTGNAAKHIVDSLVGHD